MLDVRVGNGFDVHKFKEGKEIILCGIKIPFNLSLDGHSDADVCFHAITDSILGASANGDIGKHFPPSDQKWKNMDSSFFLKKSIEMLRNQKFVLSNIDLTIICEIPKILPYYSKMSQNISKICNLDLEKINVKSTTTEKLGFLGRKEGIAALATSCIIKMK